MAPGIEPTVVEPSGLPARLAARLGPDGRTALGVWLATRLGVLVLAWMAGWLFSTTHEMPGRWLDRWNHWDAGIFTGIARSGYFGPGTDPTHVAFFPGFPAVMAMVQPLVRDWTATGLLVSLVAGTVAAVALGRLAAMEASDAAGRGSADDTGSDAQTASRSAANSVLFFALAPAAVFLAAGYSESLFAAFAFASWLAARRDRWGRAVLLAAVASAVRVNGLFLAAALLLEFLLAGPQRRSWRQTPLFLVPMLPVLGYVVYLYDRTGDWRAWQHAQAAGWMRTFASPRRSWDQTWDAAFGGTQDGHTAWVFQLELVAVCVGVVLTLWLLTRARWPEAVYVGLSLAALGTTTWFMSVPRAMLLWWPLWTALGAWAARRPVVRTVYVCCAGPVMAGVAVLFLSGQWAG